MADGALLAEGELRHVFVDPDDFEKRDIPDAVRGGPGAASPAGMIHLRIVAPGGRPPTRSLELLCARPPW